MSYSKIKIGINAPEKINVVIEIPKGSHNKYEYDEEMDEIRLDRILHSPVFYPADYGFIPQTRAEDGDHLDVLVLISESVFSGCILEVRPVGLLKMQDEKGNDDKIIAIAQKDPRMGNYTNIEDLDEHFKKEIEHFFEVYKHLESKWVKIDGFLGKEEALKLINQTRDKYILETR